MSDHPAQTTTDPVELERRLMRRDAALNPSSPGIPEIEQDSTPPFDRWTTLRKLAVALSLALIVGYLLLWAQNVQETGGPEGYIRGNANRGPVDFISTLTGALIIRDGNGPSLYDLNTQTNAQNRIFSGYRPSLAPDQILPYNHPPFEALLVAPLMGLPYPIVFALWTLLCGIAIGMSLGMLDGALPVARPIGWVMSMAACSYLPLIRGLMLGQNSPLVLLGLCALYVALKRGQDGWAGAALLLVALKPQILPVILLLLILQRRWNTLAVFAGITAALSVLAMPILGAGWPIQYIRLLLGVAGWGNTGAIDPAIMHNWRGFFANLLGTQFPALVTPLFALFALLTAALLAWAWWRSREQGAGIREQGDLDVPHSTFAYSPQFDLLWALAGIAALLTSLHLNPHDLTLLVFPAWIIGAYATSGLWSRPYSRLWIALLWLGYILAPFTLTSSTEVVIPSVLLMALATSLLAARLANPSQSQDDLLPAPA